jgi:hypothetical protein
VSRSSLRSHYAIAAYNMAGDVVPVRILFNALQQRTQLHSHEVKRPVWFPKLGQAKLTETN